MLRHQFEKWAQTDESHLRLDTVHETISDAVRSQHRQYLSHQTLGQLSLLTVRLMGGPAPPAASEL